MILFLVLISIFGYFSIALAIWTFTFRRLAAHYFRSVNKIRKSSEKHISKTDYEETRSLCIAGSLFWPVGAVSCIVALFCYSLKYLLHDVPAKRIENNIKNEADEIKLELETKRSQNKIINDDPFLKKSIERLNDIIASDPDLRKSMELAKIE